MLKLHTRCEAREEYRQPLSSKECHLSRALKLILFNTRVNRCNKLANIKICSCFTHCPAMLIARLKIYKDNNRKVVRALHLLQCSVEFSSSDELFNLLSLTETF